VQTKAGAQAEERRIIEHFGTHGTIAALLAPPVKVEEPDTRTWADAVKLYKEWAPKHLRPSTRAGYEELLDGKWFACFKGLELVELAKDVARLTRWDGELAASLGESRRRNAHVVLRTVMRVAEDADWHPGLVKFLRGGQGTGKRSLPKVGEREILATHPEDVDALLGESDEGIPATWAKARRAARLAWSICAFAGLRASEVRALRWKHVDLRTGVIHVMEALCVGEVTGTKSGNQRMVPVSPRLAELLTAAHEARTSEYVAPNPDGEAWSDKALYHSLARAVARLKLTPSRMHGLRHHFVTVMFQAGKSARVVQKLAGHSSLVVTQRYADATSEAMADAVSVFASKPGLKVIDGGNADKKQQSA
jgi:integrase